MEELNKKTSGYSFSGGINNHLLPQQQKPNKLQSILKTPTSRESVQPTPLSSSTSSSTSSSSSLSLSPTTPSTASSKVGTSKLLSTSDLITPIKSNSNNINLPTFLNESTPLPNQTPGTKNRVMMSEIKPTVHIYPSSPLDKTKQPIKSKGGGGGGGGGGLFNINKFLNRSNHLNLNDTTIIDQTMNDKNLEENEEGEEEEDKEFDKNKSFLSSNSSKFYRNGKDNNNINDNNNIINNNNNNLSPTSEYYPSSISSLSYKSISGSSSGGSGSKSMKKTPIIRKKSLKTRIKETIKYPINKLDKIQEDIATFHDNKYYKTLIYCLALLLNLILLSYAIDLISGLPIGLVLLSISLINSILFFKSSKKSYLYRFEGTQLGPNMSIEQIESIVPGGNETKDNVVVLKIWNPKFPSKILFNFFSPLHVLMMSLSSPEFEKFLTFTVLSIIISSMFYFFGERYEQKIRDEKVLFSQVCLEYNHFMKVKPLLKDKGTQTNSTGTMTDNNPNQLFNFYNFSPPNNNNNNNNFKYY
ncbi:hypothetical protein ACTA71_000997 [Dictyostelium dimigraforme]